MGKQKVLAKLSTVERSSVFAFFWGLAHFIDEFRQPVRFVIDPIAGGIHLVVFFLAISVMFKPSSTLRLFSMSALSVLVILAQMPITPNHNMIVLMGDLAVVTGIGFFAFQNKRDIADWFRTTEPFLRIALFVTYGSATIAKFNTDFLFSDISCAFTMPQKEFGWISFIDWQSLAFMPFLIAGTEMLIWLLPLFRKTRVFGLILASGFHVSLSLTPVSQGLGFSYILFALLVLYLPDAAHARIIRFARDSLALLKAKGLFATAVYGFVGLAGFIAFVSFVEINSPIHDFIRYIPALIGLAVFAGSISYLAWSYRKQPQVTPAIGIKHWWQWILIVLIAFNSISPYLGLKTYATMTMYSNLSVSSTDSNHLIFPPTPWETRGDDVIRILDSNNLRLKSYSMSGLDLTWHEVRRELVETPQAFVVYERDGEVVSLNTAAEEADFRSLDTVLHKLVGFRPVANPPICLW